MAAQQRKVCIVYDDFDWTFLVNCESDVMHV
jgi:hypothetical protein